MLQTIEFPAKHTTSCCFGGPNLDELYVTGARSRITEEEFRTNQPLAGSVFKVTGLGAKGFPANCFEGWQHYWTLLTVFKLFWIEPPPCPVNQHSTRGTDIMFALHIYIAVYFSITKMISYEYDYDIHKYVNSIWLVILHHQSVKSRTFLIHGCVWLWQLVYMGSIFQHM